MPHIHTKPNQHDITTSAFILLKENDEVRCLVHLHRRIKKLMQVGGHIELDETPWQSIVREIEEESGFTIDELDILQPTNRLPIETGCTIHPVPFTMNTYRLDDIHFHSDLGFGFFASGYSQQRPVEGESSDIRWLTLHELEVSVKKGEALHDVYANYAYLIAQLPEYTSMPARRFALTKPTAQTVTYYRGTVK